MPSPATGTQGYQTQAYLPVGTSDCIAHLPSVKAKPLRGGWFCTRWKDAGSGNLGISVFVKAKVIRCSLALNNGQVKSSVCKTYLSVAVTEPLAPPLRALFGHPQRGLITFAVIEPLGSPLRALFGHPW